jgi:hypothetical protein
VHGSSAYTGRLAVSRCDFKYLVQRSVRNAVTTNARKPDVNEWHASLKSLDSMRQITYSKLWGFARGSPYRDTPSRTTAVGGLGVSTDPAGITMPEH